MAIYEPTLILSETDREALVLLAQLALASQGEQSNVTCDTIALSPAEARRLLILLEEFANSKLFLEGSYFAEGIANGEGRTNDRLKEIYLSWRTRRGRTRVASTYTWNEFIFRIGGEASQEAGMWPSQLNRTPLRPMTLQHFVLMEAKLASVAGLHPRIKNLIIKLVEQARPQLDDLRERKAIVQKGSIRAFVDMFVRDLSDQIKGQEKSPMTRQRIVALSTIVMDTAALFATRDWTAAGVLSSLAAVAPDAFNYSPPR